MTRPGDDPAPGLDPELSRLLIEELERHLLTLATQAGVSDDVQQAMHALRGTTGLAGERELSSAIGRLHRRMKEGDPSALPEALSIVETAVKRLKSGESAVAARWPIPPDDLLARPLDPLAKAQYAAEVTDRLARIDEAVANTRDPTDAARDAFRHVHTMKGAASAVGDDPMTWFCHGLEEVLKATNSAETARAALETLAGWRVVLRGLLDDPATALATLRSRGRPSQVPRGSLGPRRASVRPRESDPPRSSAVDDATATIRVAALDVDRLLERFDAIDVASEYLATRAERARDNALDIRQLRAALGEALRLIGPPRPWGAPLAAIRRVEQVIASLGVLSEEPDAPLRAQGNGPPRSRQRRRGQKQLFDEADGHGRRVRSAHHRHRVRIPPQRPRRHRPDPGRRAHHRPSHRRAARRAVLAAGPQRRRARHRTAPRTGGSRQARDGHHLAQRAKAGQSTEHRHRRRRVGSRREAPAGARDGRRPHHAGHRRQRGRRHSPLASLRSRVLDARLERPPGGPGDRARDRAGCDAASRRGHPHLESRGRRIQRAHRRTHRERAGECAVAEGRQRRVRDPGGGRQASSLRRRVPASSAPPPRVPRWRKSSLRLARGSSSARHRQWST